MKTSQKLKKKQPNFTSADTKEAVANFHPQVLFWKCQVFCSHPINIRRFSNLFKALLEQNEDIVPPQRMAFALQRGKNIDTEV